MKHHIVLACLVVVMTIITIAVCKGLHDRTIRKLPYAFGHK